MPFISGPSGTDGIKIDQTDIDIKEFNAISESGIIKAGTPIAITNVYDVGELKTLSGMANNGSLESNIHKLKNNRILIYNNTSYMIQLVDLVNDSLVERTRIILPTVMQNNMTYSGSKIDICVMDSTTAVVESTSTSAGYYVVLSISDNTMMLGTVYTFTVSNPTSYYADMVKLDSTHVLVNAITHLSSDSWQQRQCYCILTINGKTISQGVSLTLNQDTRNKATMIRTKNYVFTIFDEDSSGNYQYSACLKYSTNTLTLCGNLTLNCRLYSCTHVSGDTIYTYDTTEDSFSACGCQIICSDSGLDPNFSYRYLITSSATGQEWWWPDGQCMCSNSVVPSGILINDHTLVWKSSYSNSDETKYVIFKDSTYSRTNTYGEVTGKSFILHRQFISPKNGKALYETSYMMVINDDTVLCTGYGVSSSGYMSYRIAKIKPTVCPTTYIADGIASSDITATSGKCYIF